MVRYNNITTRAIVQMFFENFEVKTVVFLIERKNTNSILDVILNSQSVSWRVEILERTMTNAFSLAKA